MKNYPLLLLLLFASSSFLFSQTATEPTETPDRARNSIHLGLGGYNQYIGLNFEHLWLVRKNSILNFRVGVPWLNLETRESFPEQSGKSLSVGVGFAWGKKSSFLDFSLNYNIMDGRKRLPSSFKVTQMPSVFVGYRLQKPHGGFFLKAGVSAGALLRPWQTAQPVVLPTLDIGYTIPGRDAPRLMKEKREETARRRAKKPAFVQQLLLTGSIGTGLNFLKQRGDFREGGLGGGTNLYLRPNQNLAGLQIGGILEYRFSQRGGISTGLAYSHERLDMRYSRSSYSTNPDYVPSSHGGDLRYTLPTLRIPFNVHLNIGDEVLFGVLAGPYVAIPLAWQAHGVVNNQVEHKEYSDGRDGFEGLQPGGARLGMALGFQFRASLGERSHVQLRVRGGRDLHKIFLYPDGGITWIQLGVGYGIRLF